MRDRLAEIFAWATFGVGALLLGAGILEIMVYWPNWLHDMPRSLLTTQQFLAVHTPGYFFRMFAPAAILLALLTIGAGWGNRPVRYAMILGALLSAGADVLTLHLVYPQFDVLLAEDVAGRPLEELQAAAAALYFWGAWMRVPLLMAAVFGCYLYSARTMTVSRAVS